MNESISALTDINQFLPCQPQVIFLDAVGTLFGVRGSVGEIYAQMAAKYGVNVSPTELEKAFYQAFKEAPPACFPGAAAAEIAQREYQWWYAVSAATFQEAGVFDQFDHFEVFYRHLFDSFATAEHWFVYPDVLNALQNWQAAGISLGIISNFDSRLYQVLNALNLSVYFSSVTISTAVGAAKPEGQIFEAALKNYGCDAGDAYHIGDSFKEDYCGARDAGLRAIWLKREDFLRYN